MSNITLRPARRTFGSRLSKARSSLRSATTGVASTQPPDIRGTSDWTRCVAVRPRLAGGSRSRARQGLEHSYESVSRQKRMAPEMEPAWDETIGVLVVDDHEV